MKQGRRSLEESDDQDFESNDLTWNRLYHERLKNIMYFLIR